MEAPDDRNGGSPDQNADGYSPDEDEQGEAAPARRAPQ